MTTTDLLEREEAPPAMTPKQRPDLETLAQIREARFRIRKARHDADRALDPRLRAMYTDRTILTTEEIQKLLGYGPKSAGRISIMRGGEARIVPTSIGVALGMKPGVLPGMDEVIGWAFGQIRPGTERGRVIEWAIKDHRLVFSPQTGQLYPNANFRSGRPRAVRPTMSRAVYVPNAEDRRRKPAAEKTRKPAPPSRRKTE